MVHWCRVRWRLRGSCKMRACVWLCVNCSGRRCDYSGACVVVVCMHGGRRVTLWDKHTGRKLSGFTAPKGKNLLAYLAAHPHLEVRDVNCTAKSL